MEKIIIEAITAKHNNNVVHGTVSLKKMKLNKKVNAGAKERIGVATLASVFSKVLKKK